MKVFTFDAFHGSKHYGDRKAPRQIVIVKNAASKRTARDLAAKCVEGLRIVNAGKGFDTYESALNNTTARLGLYNRTNPPGTPSTVWYAMDAADPEAAAKHNALVASLAL